MRLWYHPESDSLYISEEWDGVSEDVTDMPAFRVKAKALGLKFTYEGQPADRPARTMADAIVASYKRWERKPADLYPTPCNATESIMTLISRLSILSDGTVDLGGMDGRSIKRVWEPACADGRIARVLEWHGLDVTGTDLREHTGYGVGGIDFLADDVERKIGLDPTQFDLIMTNPPFSLAREFIEMALRYAPVVIMLVKQNYYNTDNRFDFFNDLRPRFFLPLTWRLAFLPERGKSPLMDCAWAVWTRDTQETECYMQPIKRKAYPGYHSAGIVGATAAMTEAVDELAKLLIALRTEK